jgi:DNA-binding transcriptional ArsR family regulator
MPRSAAQPSASIAALDAAAHALADPTRRRILRIVRDDELSAGAVAEQFTHLSRPAVSQHLRVLHDAELVTVRRAGNHRMYRSRPEGLQSMRAFIDEMWADHLSRLKRAAEAAERAPHHPSEGNPS